MSKGKLNVRKRASRRVNMYFVGFAGQHAHIPSKSALHAGNHNGLTLDC